MSSQIKGRLLRRLGWVVGGLAICLLLAYATALALSFRNRSKAERLIQDLRALKVGETTAEEVRKLSDRYSGRLTPAVQTELVGGFHGPQYEIFISTPSLQIGKFVLVPWGPGIRRWWTYTQLEISADRLESLHISVNVLRPDDYSLNFGLTTTQDTPSWLPEGARYYVDEHHITGPPGESLGVELTASASEEERRRAFEIRMDCLTSVAECKHVCEVAPSAWADLRQEQRLHFGGGDKGEIDAYCREVLARRK